MTKIQLDNYSVNDSALNRDSYHRSAMLSSVQRLIG